MLRPSSGPQLEAWVRHTQPVTFGDRLTVAYVWSEHDRTQLPNVLEIDPAGGFGSAQHPAARLILEQLVVRITGGERVLDIGCGNGVLGLSALRLGAGRLTAVDIDPEAVDATARNAALNGFEQLVDDRIAGVFDVVLANIGRSALTELGPDLGVPVGPGRLGCGERFLAAAVRRRRCRPPSADRHRPPGGGGVGRPHPPRRVRMSSWHHRCTTRSLRWPGLIGTWSGPGHGHYPTIEPFDYVETVTIGHVGKPFLSYLQRTQHPSTGLPMHTETGYFRMAGSDRVELVIAQPTGVVEVLEGTVDAGTIRLRSTLIGRTGSAKEVTQVERELTVRDDRLSYVIRMAAVGSPLSDHLEAELDRVE